MLIHRSSFIIKISTSTFPKFVILNCIEMLNLFISSSNGEKYKIIYTLQSWYFSMMLDAINSFLLVEEPTITVILLSDRSKDYCYVSRLWTE